MTILPVTNQGLQVHEQAPVLRGTCKQRKRRKLQEQNRKIANEGLSPQKITQIVAATLHEFFGKISIETVQTEIRLIANRAAQKEARRTVFQLVRVLISTEDSLYPQAVQEALKKTKEIAQEVVNQACRILLQNPPPQLATNEHLVIWQGEAVERLQLAFSSRN